jgi:type III pantothenate kinase
MKLLVDIGNSRVKWTTMDNNGLEESHSFDRNKSGIKASLNKEWKTLSEIESIYVANVAG